VNSRNKGKVGEREFASLLREHGFDARRGQQFSGSPDSPDVVSAALAWLHVEVKRVQHLNLTDACVQAEGDCGGKPWIVAHRRNHAPWLITMRAETFFRLLRGELPPVAAPRANRTDGTDTANGLTSSGLQPPSPQSGEGTAREDSCPTETILGESPERTGETPVPLQNNNQETKE
jgi:hypothetical protein